MIALITGATSGIGRATAIKLAKENYSLIITGRRNDRLVEFRNELSSKYKIQVLELNFDVRDRETINNIFNNLPEHWRNVDVLINNAGLAAGLDYVQDGSIADWEEMIDTNIKGLLYMTRKIAPLMIQNGSGHIINIGSIAGNNVYEKGNVYCATKHAVKALSEGMRVDMLKFGVRVTEISPGAVDTEFSPVRFKGDLEKAKQVYNGYKPLSAEDVAEVISFALSRPPHVNINEILIMPTAQANAYYVNRTI